MVRKLLIITVSLLLIACTHSFSQGCSDAGFCTLNSLQPELNDSSIEQDNRFTVGTFWGRADNSITVYGGYLEFIRTLNRKFSIDLKITTLAQSGNGISVFGLSDVFIQSVYHQNKDLHFTIGLKAPLSDGNRKMNGLSLPMDYQSSLGTFDMILGVGYTFNKLRINAAIQQPLSQNNNQFISSNHPEGSQLKKFQSTNQFSRSGDIMVRLSYPFEISSRTTITPGVLPIYHISNDKYTDEFGIEKEINGSEGLTFNGNLYLDYELNGNNRIQFNVGMPFIVRQARLDGLTRSLIAALEYSILF